MPLWRYYTGKKVINTRAKLSGDFYEVKVKSDRIVLKCGGEKACRIVDNQNGLTVKFYSHSSCNADKYLSLDYDHAEELYHALKGFYEV